MLGVLGDLRLSNDQRRGLEYQLPLHTFSAMLEEEELKGILVALALALSVGYMADNYWYYGRYSAQVSQMLAQIVHHIR